MDQPFSTMIQYETSPYTIDSSHMQMVRYDEKLKKLGPCISGDFSMIYLSYLSSIKEARYTKDPFENIHLMVGPYYQYFLCSSRSIEELVHISISYIGECLMMHSKKADTSRWIGMIFIPRFHSI